MSKVQALKGDALSETPLSSGITRHLAFKGDGYMVLRARTGSRVMSGWHHHADYILYGYVISGSALFESDRGEEAVTLGPGIFSMFLHIPSIERPTLPPTKARSFYFSRAAARWLLTWMTEMDQSLCQPLAALTTENKPFRVAALYDIHANLPALEAVLNAVKAANVNLILIGGDIISGPMPRQTLDRLIALDRPLLCIHGNADREVVAAFDGQDLSHLPAHIRAIARWTAQQIDRSQRDFLANLPASKVINIQSLGAVLFCHAAPLDDTMIFTKVTPEEYISPLLTDTEQSLIVCGHTHMQFVRQIGLHSIVNAGSVGMPYGAPGADWALLGPKIQLMHTSYDLEQAAAQIRATAYPEAEDFALNNVLQPPTEGEAIEAFERQAAKRPNRPYREVR